MKSLNMCAALDPIYSYCVQVFLDIASLFLMYHQTIKVMLTVNINLSFLCILFLLLLLCSFASLPLILLCLISFVNKTLWDKLGLSPLTFLSTCTLMKHRATVHGASGI